MEFVVPYHDSSLQECVNFIGVPLVGILCHNCCAILMAHQLLWQNMEAPVSIFQEFPLAGEPRQRLFHIHSVNRYQLRTKYL